MAEIVTDPAHMTPGWLTEVLGGPFDGVTVSDFEATPVGTGQMGDSVRLVLTHDGVEAPTSVVAKLPAADEKSRQTAAALRSYEIEVNFYRHLASTVDMRTPACFHADFDPATSAFVLMLEDMAPAEQGDQLEGTTPERAGVAVEELPKLHAPRWGDPGLGELDWFARSTPEMATFTVMLISGLWDGFQPRFDGRIRPEIMGVATDLMANLSSYLTLRDGPMTVSHGDYRLDNLLFATERGGDPVTVVDWQTATQGYGVADLSYFVSAGLVPEDRRTHERDLVDRYRDGMAARGVRLDSNDLWEDFRRFSFAGLMMAIAASMLVEETERGDEMFITMAERHGQHALDLDAIALL